MRGYGLPGKRAAGRRPARRSLSAWLAVVVFCAAALGGLVITAATHLVARDYLAQQADRQLRSYADLLTARPFAIFPGSRLAPGASGLGPAGPELGVAVRAPGGQLLMSAGPAAPPTAGHGWLEISEPVGYRAAHIPFVYDADDSSVLVTPATGTPRTGPALPGTLVVGLNLAAVGRAVDGLTVSCLIVTGLAALLAMAAAAGITRGLLRPLMRAAQTEAAAAEASTRAVTERTCAAVITACGQMRRPLSIVAGLADCHRERRAIETAPQTGPPSRPGAGAGAGTGTDGADGTMRLVAREAARMAALVDELEAATRDEPARAGHAKTRWPARARP